MTCLVKPLRLDVAALDSSPLPIDLDLVREHCAIDGNEFDTLLATYLLAAIRWAENTTHRTLFQRPHRWVLREFPADRIRLPRGRTARVESIAYVAGGQVVTLTDGDWQEDLASDSGGELMAIWPAADLDAVTPVAITFTAGYPAGELPADILHALMFAVSDMFDTRGSADLTSGGRNFEHPQRSRQPLQAGEVVLTSLLCIPPIFKVTLLAY
jgi:uncharacterized phiE125 gp8 family phage protein